MSVRIRVSKKVRAQCESSEATTKQVEILDDTKQPVKCDVIGGVSNGVVHCFWDRHPIKEKYIQCPIRAKPKQIVKEYKHNISNEDYTIKENIVSSSKIKPNLFKVIPESLEVADTFCSFSCCLAWIQFHKFDPLYDQSEMLLLKLWREAGHTVDEHLDPAPSWRLLSGYGGSMSIEAFRSRCSRTEFTYRGTILETKHLFSKTSNL